MEHFGKAGVLFFFSKALKKETAMLKINDTIVVWVMFIWAIVFSFLLIFAAFGKEDLQECEKHTSKSTCIHSLWR